MRERKIILFDLDGTLTDPAQGIFNSVRYALAQMDAPEPDNATLRSLIGPPMLDSLSRFVGPERAAQALQHYRQRYDVDGGMFENKVYDAIPDVLRQLRDGGKALYVATTKPHVTAKRILAHFALDGFFTAIHGAEMDGTRADKGELIAYILAQHQLDPAATAMIGDRKYDMIGAKKNHVAALGILWGYGDRAELEQAGADRLAATPYELTKLLL